MQARRPPRAFYLNPRTLPRSGFVLRPQTRHRITTGFWVRIPVMAGLFKSACLSFFLFKRGHVCLNSDGKPYSGKICCYYDNPFLFEILRIPET